MQIPDRSVGPAGQTPVLDYEGSSYRTDFWEGQGREYEDRVERYALQGLLPAHGRRIAEIGAGFGRLADLYQGYGQVILLDYSRSLLAEAVARWGHDSRFVFVAGNIYHLPLADGVLDALVMVRVMHHLARVPDALGQLQRAVRDQGTLVLEYANKRNLKALLRWVLGRQGWSPLDRQPYEFVALNFDFHPGWMADQLAAAGLVTRERWGVSHLRLSLLKRLFPISWLARMDRALFGLGGAVPLAPSLFVQAAPRPRGSVWSSGMSGSDTGISDLFCCPVCRGAPLAEDSPDRLSCPDCGRCYGRVNQIWDFKEAISQR